MLIFYPKIIIFSLDDANCPNFRRNVGFHICCPIFVKLFAKKVTGGSDKYEICRVEHLDRAEKKSSKQPFCQTSRSRSKYLPNIFYHLYHETDIWQGFYYQRSTRPQYIHHILSYFNCYWLFCKFADYGPAINSHPNM